MSSAILKAFLRDEHGQDLAEYCLITAFIALVAAGILIHMSGGLQGTWGNANSTLATGNSGATHSTVTGQ